MSINPYEVTSICLLDRLPIKNKNGGEETNRNELMNSCLLASATTVIAHRAEACAAAIQSLLSDATVYVESTSLKEAQSIAVIYGVSLIIILLLYGNFTLPKEVDE